MIKTSLPRALGVGSFKVSYIQRGFVRIYYRGKYIMEFASYMPLNSYQLPDNELIEGYLDLIARLHKRRWLFQNQKEAQESSERISKNFSVK